MNDELTRCPAFRALINAWIADPRNPHMIPALIDYFDRAEYPRQARLLRESGPAFDKLAKAMKAQTQEQS